MSQSFWFYGGLRHTKNRTDRFEKRIYLASGRDSQLNFFLASNCRRQ
jgi:hypothetical protein